MDLAEKRAGDLGGSSGYPSSTEQEDEEVLKDEESRSTSKLSSSGSVSFSRGRIDRLALRLPEIIMHSTLITRIEACGSDVGYFV